MPDAASASRRAGGGRLQKRPRDNDDGEGDGSGASGAAANGEGPGARPKRDMKKKPVYVQETMVFAARLPKNYKSKKNKPKPTKDKDGAGAAPKRSGGAGGASPNRRRFGNQWGTGSYAADGSRVFSSGAAPVGRPTPKRVQSERMEPLLRGSKAAEDWGCKMVLEQGVPHCPLYYGCPEPSQYFCCERHRQLWQDGALLLGRPMPAAWKLSAPDPEWVTAGQSNPNAVGYSGGGGAANGEGGPSAGDDTAGRADQAEPQEQPQQQARGMAMASWVREKEGEEEEDEEDEDEEGEEEEEEGEEDDEEGEEDEEDIDGRRVRRAAAADGREDGEEEEEEEDDDDDRRRKGRRRTRTTRATERRRSAKPTATQRVRR